ncbi:Rne/Rng family ribonuclease [Georgenia sp. SYP-B2076]|uniref:Rne/Rng family ribonuclease n=1 Tax=Georgenia sp. SYP-B2076 TaxID=2495881 RepID=UPI000F8CA507|nr:Rne/Rng family ribonuclease [Georgenia sp. SYP-B2076]
MTEQDSTTSTEQATVGEQPATPPRRSRARRATSPVLSPGAAPSDDGTTAEAPEAPAPATTAPAGEGAAAPGADGAAAPAPAKKPRTRRAPAKKAAAAPETAPTSPAEDEAGPTPPAQALLKKAPARRAPRKTAAKSAAEASAAEAPAEAPAGETAAVEAAAVETPAAEAAAVETPAAEAAATDAAPAAPKRTRARRATSKVAPESDASGAGATTTPASEAGASTEAGAGATAPRAPRTSARAGASAPTAPTEGVTAEPTGVEPSSSGAADEFAGPAFSDLTPGVAVSEPTTAVDEQEPARRPARRSRRASAPARSPEQRLDVLAELGVGRAAETGAEEDAEPEETAPEDVATAATPAAAEDEEPRLAATALLFQAPDPTRARTRRRRAQSPVAAPSTGEEAPEDADMDVVVEDADAVVEDEAHETTEDEQAGGRRRRRRGGRGRRNRGGQSDAGTDEDEDAHGAEDAEANEEQAEEEPAPQSHDEGDEAGSSSRRRRRRRRSSGGSETSRTVDIEAGGRTARDEVTALKGSTRLEAKRQRRREGREAGRRRPTLSEAEFLARREAVDRKMLVREKDGLNQIAVLEDGILVEHYVARHTQSSMVGNVYLGRVQNVLPSMEAAFIDLGKGRNAVLYAGEVNWDAAGMEGQPRRIEQALKSGDAVLVQVTKDPIGHKGARLTSQITLAGRHLVLVPSGAMTGISRKLPEPERARLKKLLKQIVPDGAGVIVRTAAEGASEEQLRADVERLTKQWADIEAKAKGAKAAPLLLKGEPELAVRVVRDVFNEDFESLVVSGGGAWQTISGYVKDLSPDLADRMHHWTSEKDVFGAHRVDEQLAKAMDRKVWLPSGGSLVIDRTEAMTVIDVNTGKFTGSGGTLEETVTRNNIEAAEEIVRQLRLRDIGGIIVIDFIDMVLESNRDLVMRRLLECLGRDRTRHQVAEVTSLGLVQMTRKRVGQGLVEAFSTPCEHCNGRGFIVHDAPVERSGGSSEGTHAHHGHDDDEGAGSHRRGRRGGSAPSAEASAEAPEVAEDPAAVAAREAVKATLATIAAAAASAHDGIADATSGDGGKAGTGASRDRARATRGTGAASEATAPAAEVPARATEVPALGAEAPAPAAAPVVGTSAPAVTGVIGGAAPAPVVTGVIGGPAASTGSPAPVAAGTPSASVSASAPVTGAGGADAAQVPQDEAPAAPAPKRARRSRRAVSSGVVTPGETKIVTVEPAAE